MTADPAGGSERYFVELLRAMARRGATIETLTTTTRELHPSSVLGIRWDREGSGTPAGIGKVRRYAPWNLPRPLARSLATAVLAADAEMDANSASQDDAVGICRGFYAPEIWRDGGFPFRWTGRSFAIRLPHGTRELRLSAFAPRRLALHCPAVGWRQSLLPGTFREIVVPVPEGRELALFHVSRLLAPAGDMRGLGIALRSAVAHTAQGRCEIPLDESSHRDDASLLRLHREAAHGRGLREEIALALLRGPLSPSLALSAVRRARGADVILAGSVPFLSLDVALLAGRLSRKPVAILPFFHPADAHHHTRRIFDALARADLVFTFTDHLRTRLLAPLRCRSAALGGGVDPREHAGDRVASARQMRARLGISDGDFLAIAVGRRAASKRFEDALHAVVVARRTSPRMRLVLAGPGTDAIPVSEVDRALGALPREDLLALYGAADVLLQPSDEESLGLVVLEAWAEGTPVIANGRCGALSELVRHGVDGLHASGPEEMAAILIAMESDREKARAMGRAGRERTLATRSWDRAGEEALLALTSLVRDRVS